MATVTSIESAGELTMNINTILANIRLDRQTNKIVLNDVLDMFNIDSGNKCRYYNRLKKNHPTLFSNEEKLRVNGKGQRQRVIDIPSTIEIIWMLPGDRAFEFRRKSIKYFMKLIPKEIEIETTNTETHTQPTTLPSLLHITISHNIKNIPKSSYIYIFINVDTFASSNEVKIGRASDLQKLVVCYRRLTQKCELVFYRKCQDKADAVLAERLVFRKLKNHRVNHINEQFTIPPDGCMHDFINTINQCVDFIGGDTNQGVLVHMPRV